MAWTFVYCPLLPEILNFIAIHALLLSYEIFLLEFQWHTMVASKEEEEEERMISYTCFFPLHLFYSGSTKTSIASIFIIDLK